MSTFLDMLSGSQCVSLEKCGDVVVSTTDCMIALYCHFCRDLFTQLPEFLRHLQSAHSDVLHFTKEHNVYSVEELMSGEQEEAQEDAQSVGHNSSSSDSRILAKSEDSRDIEGSEDNSDNSPVKSKQKGSQSEINLLAEVTNIVLQTKEKEHINNEPKPENGGFKGPRKKANSESSSLRICNLKSHTIARTSRKRMSMIKNRILRVIDSDLSAKQMKPSEPNCKAITEPIQEANIPGICFETPNKPIPSSSNLSVRKSSLTEANVLLAHGNYAAKKTTPTLPKLLNCAPKPILPSQQAQAHSGSSGIHEIYHISKAASQVPKETKSFPIEITQIEVFPPPVLPETSTTTKKEEDVNAPGENNTRRLYNAQNLPKDKPKKFFKKRGEWMKNEGSPNKSVKITKSRVNPIIVKRVQTSNVKSSPGKTQIRANEKTKCFASEFNSTKNRKLKMENFIALKKEDPCSTGNIRLNKMATISNCEILKVVGLPAISDKQIEDTLLLDELETMREKADQFSKIYRKYDSIWNYRKIVPPGKPQHISQKMFALTREVNETMGCNLANSAIKSIINQISVWHYNIYTKYIVLDTISETARYTLKLFSFLPVSFAYFCKCCDDIFTLNEDYIRHLVSQQARYQCTKCVKAFKYQGHYDKHLRTVHP
ncbi:protein teflon [Drosophila teissieri]|uniref:protein teflon n=1 Tax=Drosophila teissieri TaxID=7243 RepID=UPI001CBA4A1E|nr:protein teflon [Drosophila teissieri]